MNLSHPRSGASQRTIHVILLAATPDDTDDIRQALAATGRHVKLLTVDTPEQARAFLAKRGSAPEFSVPDLILLDYQETVVGAQFLSVLKGDPGLRVIPVVALAASGSDREIRSVYDSHVNCCIVKPTRMQDLCKALVAALDFWLDIAITIQRSGRASAG